jgi:hypothetical protein
VYASASALDFLHFYGFGNETRADGSEDRYEVSVAEYIFEPALVLPLGETTFLLRARARQIRALRTRVTIC